MAAHKEVLGIDISTNAIHMAQVRLEKTPILSRIASVPTNLGGLVDESGALLHPDRLKDLLEQVMVEHAITAKHVHLSIPSRYVAVRQLTLPNGSDKELRQMIQFELASSVHLPFANPVFDFVRVPQSHHSGTGRTDEFSRINATDSSMIEQQLRSGNAEVRDAQQQPLSDTEALKILLKQRPTSRRSWWTRVGRRNPVGGRPARGNCDVILVAAPKSLVDSLVQVATALKLQVVSVDLAALAVWRVLTADLKVSRSAVIVQITPQQININLFFDGYMRLNRMMPMDLAEFERGMGESLTNQDLAAYREVAAARGPSEGGTISDLDIPALGRELATEIGRTLHFLRYTLQHREIGYDEVIIVGAVPGGAALAGEVQGQLGTPVRAVNWRQLSYVQAFMERDVLPADVLQESEFTPAIGLALRGVKRP